MGEMTRKQKVIVIFAGCALLALVLLLHLIVLPIVLTPPLTLGEVLASHEDDINIETGEGSFLNPQFTSDGNHIVYLFQPVGKTEGDIWIMNRDGGNRTRLTEEGSVQKVFVSPVSNRIAYSFYDRGTISVGMVSTNGAPKGQITGPAPFTYFSSWSPDGKWMALTGIEPSECHSYEIRPDGNRIPSWGNEVWSRLYILNADGGDQRYIGNVTHDELSVHTGTSWSPDGTRIAFPYYDQGTTGIGVSNLETGHVIKLTQNGGIYPRWSPDGDWIAFIMADTIHLMHPDGSGLRRISTEGAVDSLSWNPEGSRLVYTTGDMIGIVDPDGANLTPISEVRPGPVSWSPDGKAITFSPSYGSRIRILTLSPEVIKKEGYLYQNLEGLRRISNGN
jgi:Tol biopolymer transport system component